MSVAIACLVLAAAVSATPIEELFDVPNFDAQGQKILFDGCLANATTQFTGAHKDSEACPATCLNCVEDAKWCPVQCKFKEACGCYTELPHLISAYEQCCNMFDMGMVRGAPQCKTGLQKMYSKVARTMEWHCGKTTTTGAPGSCSNDTGGSCAWFPCDSSRHSVCDDVTYRCVCDEHSCAKDGGCQAKDSPDDAVISFAALVNDIHLSASMKTFAPEFVERLKPLKNVESSGEKLQFGQDKFMTLASGAFLLAAVLGAVFSLRMFQPRQKPMLIDEALG